MSVTTPINLTPQRVTDGLADDQLLYFTCSSLTADDRTLFFLSNRTGSPNIFAMPVDGSEPAQQISDNRDGMLRSYVYFDGVPECGLGKASVSLDAPRGIIYYLQGNQILKAGRDAKTKVLATLPDGQVTAFTHVSRDGRWLCVPTTDARALEGPLSPNGKPAHDIDARCRSEGVYSYLRVFDTTTGRQVACEPRQGCWITHVQFAPHDPQQLLYNHEWSADSGVRRIWLWDGSQHRALRTAVDGRSEHDWVSHEVWQRDGQGIIYHGGFHDGSTFIGWMRPDGSEIHEIALPTGSTRYGHFTEGPAGVLVTDGYFEQADDPDHTRGSWISRLDVDWRTRRIDWRPLCRHGSSWTSQDEHPHPIFDHAGDAIYFTSDVDGRRAVYRLPADT